MQTGPIDNQPAPEDAPPARAPIPLPWPPIIREKAALRPWGATPADAGALASAWADPDIARWCAVPAARGEDDAARWISGEGARRDSGLAMDLAITQPGESETVLGEVGFVVVEPQQGWAEIGFWVAPSARGEGRASSAVDAFADWVLADLPITRLFARVSKDNPASSVVAQRAHFERAGELPDGTLVWVLDRVPADETPGGTVGA